MANNLSRRSSLLSCLQLSIAPAALMAGVCVADSNIDEIVVVGESQLVENSLSLEGDALKIGNTGDILKWVPGANINRNGPLTALPQYRGASGDRVNVSVDGMTLFPGGPNAMDAPISSVPGSDVKTLSVSRGIASVSAAQETLGGHMAVTSQRGQFSEDAQWYPQVRVTSLYNGNGGGAHSSVLAAVANDQQKAGVAYSYQEGDDQDYVDGDVPNTFFRRNRVAAFYALQTEHSTLNIDVTQIATEDTGTASLPMDILYIDADTVNVDGSITVGGMTLSAAIGTQDIEHEMDNFSHRFLVDPTRYRNNYATGDHDHANFAVHAPLGVGYINAGVDYSKALHNSDISNPNNAMFAVANFNNVEKTIVGLYAEWISKSDALSWELGVRSNSWQSDADEVSGPMMVAPLAVQFNASERDRDERNTDVVAKLAYQASSHAVLSAGVAQKTRAPSYQELYLWAPLQATGGLADGRNYVGNLNLENETARELNVGMDVDRGTFAVSAQLFYRRVDDYIQGTSQINLPNAMQVNMISTMMGGQPALQFNNVEATLYGTDIGYTGSFAEHWYYRGNLSYVRGERDDVSDDLYRIAPLNHSLTLGTLLGNWDLSATSELVAKQDKVSSYNNEQASAGYGLLHIDVRWQFANRLHVVLGIDNVFDKKYAVHLNGYNRVADADVAVGERLPGAGRNVRAGVSYHF
ncbi:TonB-dependent receptor [Aurantivibrio plasticivorans]